MATTTFSGAVRSENGFKVINKNSSTGAITETSSIASTGIFTNKYVKHVGFATGVTVNTTAGDSPSIGEFTQPANTIITDIKIFCVTAPVIGTGDIGYEVGTSSSGAQIVAAITDEILDGGTTVVVGNVTTTKSYTRLTIRFIDRHGRMCILSHHIRVHRLHLVRTSSVEVSCPFRNCFVWYTSENKSTYSKHTFIFT